MGDDILVKMTPNDLELLKQYRTEGSEEAFAALVQRHLDLVYSAALRQVRSPQLAEEVAQSVFTDLSLKASQLKPDTVLTAWLYQVTRRTAIDVVRSEARRQFREQIALEMNAMNANADDWTQIEPLLDEAMDVRGSPHAAFLFVLLFPTFANQEYDWTGMLALIPGSFLVWLLAVALTFRRARTT